MSELLLELFSEEIPARMQVRAAADLAAALADRLKAAALAHDKIVEFSGPRRIGLCITGLALAQPDVSEEKKGPRVGSPDAAVQGFLKSAGLASLDQCEKRDTGKGEFWFAVIARKGRPTADVLTDIVPEAIAALPWPKSMKWGAGETRWVRPLHSIICLFDGKVLPVSFGPVTASDTTRGHRFLAPAQIRVSGFADYKAKLKAAKVEIDASDRRKLLLDEARRIAKAENLALVEDEGLANEVSGLVEWPVPLMGRIDDAFMDVPREVLTTSMRTHQKYFALNDAAGNLAPRFMVVANNVAPDGGKAIIAGNERVLRARLSDARFFWDQDRRQRLDARVAALKDIVFHAKLGTLAEKVARVERLAFNLAKHIPGCDAQKAKRAAHLAKADLVSGMVGEFPELQGIMGRYYAINDGEDKAVCEAIAAHYSPLGPNDRCPTAPESVAVALADKLDTLVGFFSIGEKPTGSKDPFALRRAALGIIRLITENGLRIELGAILGLAHLGYREQATPGFMAAYREHLATKEVKAGDVERHWNETHCVELQSFLQDRLKVQSRDKGVRHDLISAVFANNDDDLVRVLAKVSALGDFIKSADGPNLIAAYKRADNILRSEYKKNQSLRAALSEGTVDPATFECAEEKALFEAVRANDSIRTNIEISEFKTKLANLSKLRIPVDAFFEKVLINSKDDKIRINRLLLCNEITDAMNVVADFSQIEG